MQPAWGAPPPPAPKSSAGKIIGIGCVALLAISCLMGLGAMFFAKGALSGLGVGTEVGTAFVTPGIPYALTYTQNSTNETRVWLELDVSYPSGFQATGPVMVRVNGTPVSQYNLAVMGGSCASPVRESNSSFCLNWVHSEVNGNGSVSGKTRMFNVPAQAQGAQVTVSGMIFVSPGTTVRRLRVFAAQ